MISPPRTALAVLVATLGLACQAPRPASDAAAIEAVSGRKLEDRRLTGPADPAPPAERRELLKAPLDADAAVELAVWSNRDVSAMLHEVGISRGAWMQARTLPNPIVELELLPERESQLELRFEYDLTEALLAPERARSASPRVEAARYRAAEALVSLGAQTRSAFLRLQAAQARLSLTAQVLETFAARLDAARALAASGNLPERDLGVHVVAYEQARLEMSDQELACQVAREELGVVLGLVGPELDFEIDPTLPELPAGVSADETWEQTAISQSLALRASQSELGAHAAEARYLRVKGNSPDVSVDVHLLWQDPSDDPPGMQEEEWRVGGGISSTIPIFDRQNGNVRSAQGRYDAGLDRHIARATELRSQVRRVGSRLVALHARARHLKTTVLPSQRELNEQTLLQYNAMQASVFDLLDAKRRELELERLTLDVREDFLLAQIQLDALLAGASPSSAPIARSATPIFAGASNEAH